MIFNMIIWNNAKMIGNISVKVKKLPENKCKSRIITGTERTIMSKAVFCTNDIDLQLYVLTCSR